MREFNLKIGDTGENVKILQEKLKILGFYNALITGSFGEATEEGVKAFQKQYSLPQTGIVNETMWQMLFDLTQIASVITENPTLQLGSTGSYVKELQLKLKNLLYYTGPINSNYDFETLNAVKRFQYHNKITTSGIVDDQTWTLLNILYGNLNACVLDEDNENDTSIYTVVRGDTLYSIAKRFNTTVDTIKNLNCLTSNILSIGQQLKIPNSNDIEVNKPIIYTVVSGDTLYSIARRFNTTVDAIKNLNNLNSNILRIGQKLNIPSNNDDISLIYTVVSGDTLYSIARRFNTTVDAIKNLNGLTSNTLSIGQQLKIPSNNDDISLIYTVVSGDTLYSIAKRFNTTVDAIKNLNCLTSNILSIGQQLKIS